MQRKHNEQVTKEKTWYLQQINESLTSCSVVFETGRQSYKNFKRMQS